MADQVRRQVKLVESSVKTAAVTAKVTMPKRVLALGVTCTRGLGATFLRDGIPHGVWYGFLHSKTVFHSDP